MTSADPAAPLATNPHFFEEEIGDSCSAFNGSGLSADWLTDLQVLVELFKFTRKVACTSPLREVLGELWGTFLTTRSNFELRKTVKEVNPGPGVVTDEQIGGMNHYSSITRV